MVEAFGVSLLDSRSSPPALPSWRGAPTSLAEAGAACAHPLLLSPTLLSTESLYLPTCGVYVYQCTLVT
jgi:hypothetical protein